MNKREKLIAAIELRIARLTEDLKMAEKGYVRAYRPNTDRIKMAIDANQMLIDTLKKNEI